MVWVCFSQFLLLRENCQAYIERTGSHSFKPRAFYKLQQTVLALNQINVPDCGDNGEARVGWCPSAF